MSGASSESGKPYYRFEVTESVTESVSDEQLSVEPRLFDSAWLQNNNLIVRENSLGRGATTHLKFNDQAFVIRRYRRGGLIRHWSQDQFVWFGLARTRPYTEFDLLLEMTKLGLPCPKPYACQVVRQGWFYHGALIMYEIPRVATLAEILGQREITNTEWSTLGACLRRFHDASVFHSDLNANNILFNDKGEVFLIDFDKSRFRSGSGRRWKLSTLKRLQRSIMKCRANADRFFFKPANWDVMYEGYLSNER